MNYNPTSRILGFILASGFAIADNWTLQAFSWSTWLAGLILSIIGVIIAAVRTIFKADKLKDKAEGIFPMVNSISTSLFRLLVIFVLILLVPAVLYVYAFIYCIYGALLSFFAEMDPHELFGRNGFINSNFFTPVEYLLSSYWPMTLGTVLANWKLFTRPDPWKMILVPDEPGFLRIHIYVVLMPFIALCAWSLFGEAYHSIAIILLMVIFYFLPETSDFEIDIIKTPPFYK